MSDVQRLDPEHRTLEQILEHLARLLLAERDNRMLLWEKQIDRESRKDSLSDDPAMRKSKG